MQPDLPLKSTQPRRKWIPYFVSAIALVLTAEATIYVAITAKAKDKLRFENAVGRSQDDIQQRLNTYITLLRGGSGLFAANDSVSSSQFAAFVNRLNLRQQYPGVQGIGFSVRVTPQEKDALVAQMKRQGVKNFSLRPNFKRSEYHSIIYLEPQDRRNKAAIGFDMFSESTRRKAMERARDTAAPAVSGKVRLIQEIDKQKQVGFLIYVPVYRDGGIPNTVAERRAKLKGFVYSPFRASDLMAGIFGSEKYPSVNFEIYEGRNPIAANLLYSSHKANGASNKPRFTTTTTIDVAGQPWSIVFASRPQFERTSESSLVPYIALGGCAIAGVLFGITRSQVRARDAAERLAALTRSSEEALRQSEERYRAFIEQSSEGIWRFELEQPLSTELSESEQIQYFYQHGYLAECNQVMAKMYGFSHAKEIVGVKLTALLVQSEPLNIEYLRSFIRSGYKLNSAESYEVDKDGKFKYFLNNLVGIVENGFLVRAWGTQIDITERKQADTALRLSEERFRMLLENVKDYAIFLLDTDARIVRWSVGAEDILGYREAEILGQSGAIIFTPEDIRAGADKEELNTAVTQGQAEDERWHVRKDGTVFWASGIMTSLRDQTGQLQGFAKIMCDMTARKQAEEALRESNTRLQFTLEAGQLGDWDLDLVTKTARRSLRHDRIFGYDSLLPNWSYDIFLNHVYPEDRELVDRSFQHTFSTAEDWDFECRIIRLDRSIRWIWAKGSVYRDPDGNPIRLMGIVTDITDRKQAESEREQLLKREQEARAEAEAANRMKDEFLATLSHELRTPLNAMLGWTTLLRTRKFNEATTARALETIDRNTKSLQQLIEDVLDVSRIITGKLRLNICPVEIVPIIEAAIETVLPAAEAKNIQIDLGLDASVGAILADANRLQQVFWNLLTNAVKFTPKGGRVEVRLDRINSRIQVRVSDTGQGIAPDFLPYVFDRFRQADSSSTRSHGGLGLGLAIVRHLVELHGGTVRAESQGEGKGATFIVDLPIRAVRIQASESEQLQPQVTSEPQMCALSLEGLRVLVVDDEADARELLTTILTQYGAKVTAVATAGEALETIQKSQLDVLVSDIGMPGEDGYTLIRKIRAIDPNQGGKIPAVALTAYAGVQDQRQTLSAGFQIHLPKPVNPSQLATAIANLAKCNNNL